MPVNYEILHSGIRLHKNVLNLALTNTKKKINNDDIVA